MNLRRSEADENNCQVTNIHVGDIWKRERPRRPWTSMLKSDISRQVLEQKDVHDRARWSSLIKLIVGWVEKVKIVRVWG